MKKKDIRISDAIPQIPASFDAAVERTLKNVVKTPRKTTVRVIEGDPENGAETRRPLNRFQKLGLASAAAVLVLCTLGIVAFLIARGLRPHEYSAEQPVDPVPAEQQPAATPEPPQKVLSVVYQGTLYLLTEQDYAGEPDESAIVGTVAAVDPYSTAREEGHANFGEPGMPLALTCDGLFILYHNEWRMLEPSLPISDTPEVQGVFEAAYEQVVYEQSEFDRTYEERLAKMESMSEEKAQEYEQNMDAEASFLHQRLVRLQRICEVTASVEQTVNGMRLSEIAYLDGQMYFAFAASKVWAFDAGPEIRISGTQYNVIDDSGFFALKETETEQYAFYEIKPGTLSGTVQIAVRNNNNDFCFQYNVEDRTVALSQDFASPQSDISYYFLVNSVPVYPYEGFVWESKPELEADGVGVRLEDEEVRNRIPVTEYNVGMPLVVLTADGWKLDEIMVFDAAYERIMDVAGSEIPWKEGYGYVATDLLQTLSPGTYYLSAIVSFRAEDYSKGNEIAICLHVGQEGASEAQLPAMFVGEGWTCEPYVLRSDRVDPKRLGSISAMPIVAYYDDFRIESQTGINRLDVYDTEGEPLMLDQPDTDCLKTLSPGYYRLVVNVTGTDKTDYACICTLEVKKTPCLFLVNGMIIPPYENFLWEDKDGLAADGMSIFYALKDERIRGEIPYSVFFANTSFEIKPGNDWRLDRIVIYQISGEQVEQLARIERGELAETESGYAAPQALKTLSSGTYYLSAAVSHREGRRDSRGYECVIGLQITNEPAQPTLTPSEEPNPEHIPMICYGGEVYGLHREERPDTPDENAASGTVTSVVPISEIPETDGQANFGSVGLRFYETRGGLVVWYKNAWRLFVVIEFGHEG